MFSVTARIKKVSQPRGGYIPPKGLKAIEYYDQYEIEKLDSAYKPIQGLAVDYLTRFVNGTPKQDAFRVSLMGAEKVDELDNANRLLDNVRGLDAASIRNACQMVGYDVAYRRGKNYFSPVDRICPSKQMVENITILVNRSRTFLKSVGPIISSGFTFEGGYNRIIDSGDGDYLTRDTLWDFKISDAAPTKEHTLQILVYYILGIHSRHPEFQEIKNLGIYNPELNIAHTIPLSDISDETFYNVSRDVIGYCMPADIEEWRWATGTSEDAMNKLRTDLAAELNDTGFSPEKYKDGIHDITLDDYWSFSQKISTTPRPKFSGIRSIKLVKNSGYFMFVGFSEIGTKHIMYGGKKRNLNQPLEYYYQRLPEYASAVMRKFSKYWDALYSISRQIQSVVLNEEEVENCCQKYVSQCKADKAIYVDMRSWKTQHKDQYSFYGWVHGCIVDIDNFNHIYLNPYDGSVTPYWATSKYLKFAYSNVASLIAAKRPEMLMAFNRMVDANAGKEVALLTLAASKEAGKISMLEQQKIDTCCTPVTDTSMNDISDRLGLLQRIYDYHYVCAWYDKLEDEDTRPARLTAGESEQ